MAMGELHSLSAKRTAVDTSGTDGQIPTDMNARLVKLEEALKGLRESLNIVMGIIAIGVLVVLYLVARVDQLNDKVSDLPGKIGVELRDISKTLAESITAAKQTPTQVIMVPTPLPPPTPQPKPPQ